MHQIHYHFRLQPRIYWFLIFLCYFHAPHISFFHFWGFRKWFLPFTQLFEFKFGKSLLKFAFGHIALITIAPSPLFYPFNSPNNGNVINWLISSRIPITLQFQYPVRSFVLFNFFVVSSVCDYFTQNDWYPIESMYKRAVFYLFIWLFEEW